MELLEYKISNNYKILYNNTASLIVLPAINGDLGIIPSQRIVVNMLTSGVIYVFNDNKVVNRYFIFDGMLVNNNNNVEITTSEVYNLDEININDINKKIEQCKLQIKANNSTESVDYYNKKISIYNHMQQKLTVLDYQ